VCSSDLKQVFSSFDSPLLFFLKYLFYFLINSFIDFNSIQNTLIDLIFAGYHVADFT
jgi:hypothetical protein